MARTKIEDLTVERTIDANEAQDVIGAGHRHRFHLHFGGFGGHHHHHHPTFHDTSHYHYTPGHFHRHGNHFHYHPGSYQLHRTGHWHF